MGYATRPLCRLPKPLQATPPQAPQARERPPPPPTRRGDLPSQPPGRSFRQGTARRRAQEARTQARQGLRHEGPSPTASLRPRSTRFMRASLPDRCPDCRRVRSTRPTSPSNPRSRSLSASPFTGSSTSFRPVLAPMPPPGFRVQHPLQTSDALANVAAQLGPDARAAVVGRLNKQCRPAIARQGQSALPERAFSASRSVAVAKRPHCPAGRLPPLRAGSYRGLRQDVGQSDWVVPDLRLAGGWRWSSQMAPHPGRAAGHRLRHRPHPQRRGRSHPGPSTTTAR